jgi:hypothetical protein
LDEDAREDVVGGETRGQERNMSFNVGSGVVVHVYVLGGICGYKEEKKGITTCFRFRRGALMGFHGTMEKRKNRFKIGEGLK